MNHLVFSDYTIGQSHIKEGMNCEDHAEHYMDPKGRYEIMTVCDGHSDPKCFRSAKGAELGCAAAVEILKNLFEEYFSEDAPDALERFFAEKEETVRRLRAAVLQEWNQKVREDLRQNPITAEEYASLDRPPYRDTMHYYQSGKGLSHIYGATFLAAGVCGEFHLAMHIGDGIIVRLDGDGVYSTPLEEDDRDEIKGPASLCDSDLLHREKGFRIGLFPGTPQAMFLTSDGIGDMPMTAGLRETFYLFHKGLLERGEEDCKTGNCRMNPEQSRWLNDFVSYYSKQGVQDDCSLAGFVDTVLPVAEVKLPREEIEKMYQDLEQERETRKKRYEETRERLQKMQRMTQEETSDLEKQISDLKAAVAKLEEDLGMKQKTAENIRKSVAASEEDYARAEASYERNKAYIDKKAVVLENDSQPAADQEQKQTDEKTEQTISAAETHEAEPEITSRDRQPEENTELETVSRDRQPEDAEEKKNGKAQSENGAEVAEANAPERSRE